MDHLGQHLLVCIYTHLLNKRDLTCNDDKYKLVVHIPRSQVIHRHLFISSPVGIAGKARNKTIRVENTLHKIDIHENFRNALFMPD